MLPENSPTTRFVTRLYLIEESGTIPHQGQMVDVNRGDIKVSIEVYNWVFSVNTHAPYAGDDVSYSSH